MIKKLCLLTSCFLGLSALADASPIPSYKAAFHVGEEKMVCGRVMQVTNLHKRTLLNVGGSYPNEHISLLIWDTDKSVFNRKFGSLYSLYDKRVCAQGRIDVYKDHLQMRISNPQFLRKMNN